MSAAPFHSMSFRREPVSFRSLGAEIRASLVLPHGAGPHPVLVVTHGAGEFKENYLELATFLAERGFASLLLDMHGHGESGGAPFHIRMGEWSADVRAAIDFVQTRRDLDARRVGAFGLSSGGTAVLEAAMIDPRVKALVTLDATVADTMPLLVSLVFRFLAFIGAIKRSLTGEDLRLDMVSMLEGLQLAADPDINRQLLQDPAKLRAFAAFPLPGAVEAFVVDTIRRVDAIRAPTLVIWGSEDKLDPPSTGERLLAALTCEKQMVVVQGNGHAGHLDRNRRQVFELTLGWLARHLT